MSPMILVLFGPPASGKGTQAQLLAEQYSFKHVATGNILRDEIKSGSDLGEHLKGILDSGSYVSDDLMLKLIEKELDTCGASNIVFDGFPRTMNQAVAFDRILGVRNLKVDFVLNFDVDQSKLEDRIVGRYSCSQCGEVYNDKYKKPQKQSICDLCGGTDFVKRGDDNPEVLKKRVDIYLKETEILRNLYLERGVLKTINASEDLMTVSKNVEECLKKAGYIV